MDAEAMMISESSTSSITGGVHPTHALKLTGRRPRQTAKTIMAKDHDDSVEDIDDETKEDGVEEEDDIDLDDEDDEEDDAEDDKEDDDEDDSKPLTRKDLLNLKQDLKRDIDSRFIKKRVEKKSYQTPKQGRTDKNEKPWEADIRSLKDSERKRQFGYENGLAPDEVDFIFKFERKPNKETLKSPFVVGGLKELRASKNADANIPTGSSAKSVKINGKSWDELKPEERQKNFQARREAILKAKGRR